MDLPVMRKCLGQKWQNHNFWDKKKVNRKVQEQPQAEAAAHVRHQQEEKK